MTPAEEEKIMMTNNIKRYTVCNDIAYPIHEDPEGDYVLYEDHVAAIELYQLRIEELESQLEAIGAGGVSSQRITSSSRGAPVADCWSNDGGDNWLDHPAESDFVDGLKVGDEYELLASVSCWTERFRVIKAPDETSDDYKVEPVSIRATPQPAEPRLDAPAQVGPVRFGIGVKWSNVIRAAQRHHEYMRQPEQEQARMKKFGEAIKAIQPAEPVDKSENLQSTVVDKSPEMQSQPAGAVRVPSEDERVAQGIPPYNPRKPTEEEWNRLTENGRRAWGKQPAEPTNKHSLSVAEPEKEPPCET